jgi:hypothetical protein
MLHWEHAKRKAQLAKLRWNVELDAICSYKNSDAKSAPLTQDKVCPSNSKDLKNSLSFKGSNT